MDNASPKCSIVIRAYNEENHIGRLLAGVLQQTIKDIEIILVDSGSTDATIAIASRYPVKIVHISPEDFTFGRSLNLGIKQAAAEFIVIASAHVYPVYPDWLSKLLAPFDDPQVALVYGKQRGNTTTKFSEHQLFAKLFPEDSLLQQRHLFCNNANSAIRRSLWLERKYDEEITGLEDLEWANWAIGRGHVLSYAADALVTHVHNESPQQVYNRYRREAVALRVIHPKERFHFGDFMRLYISNILSDCWHAFHERVLVKELASILQFRFMQFWGTYRGFSLSRPLTSQIKQVFYYPRNLRTSRASSRRDVEPIDYQRE
ncbi:MAG: glycosyltransferase [Anaerolineales bacterium]|nr:glycosyltransferase [Anaerolineales bacterium]